MKIHIQLCMLAVMVGASITGFAQEKLFHLKFHGEDPSFIYAQIESVTTGRQSCTLEFKGIPQQRLVAAVLNYVRNRPAYTLRDADSTGAATIGNTPHISYRDFRLVCPEKTCKADIIALTYVHVYFQGNKTGVNFENDTQIYSTIFQAKLRITPEGKVASDDDLPFNELQYILPESKVKVAKFKNSSDGDAYSESIFDSKGKLLNQPAKDALEQYYNDLVNDLKTFIAKDIQK